jgi:hypothetical protein
MAFASFAFGSVSGWTAEGASFGGVGSACCARLHVARLHGKIRNRAFVDFEPFEPRVTPVIRLGSPVQFGEPLTQHACRAFIILRQHGRASETGDDACDADRSEYRFAERHPFLSRIDSIAFGNILYKSFPSFNPDDVSR